MPFASGGTNNYLRTSFRSRGVYIHYWLEYGKGHIDHISDEMRAVVESEWPELAHKLPPKRPQG